MIDIYTYTSPVDVVRTNLFYSSILLQDRCEFTLQHTFTCSLRCWYTYAPYVERGVHVYSKVDRRTETIIFLLPSFNDDDFKINSFSLTLYE